MPVGRKPEGVQGWKAVELFFTKEFGTTERSEEALWPQMDVILGRGLTEMERDDVGWRALREQLPWFGESFDQSFELFESSVEGLDASGELTLCRKKFSTGLETLES